MWFNVRWSETATDAGTATVPVVLRIWGIQFSVKFDIYKCVACNHTFTLIMFWFKEAILYEPCQMCVSMEKPLYRCMYVAD